MRYSTYECGENICFGMKMQKVPAAEQKERAEEAMRLTQLLEFRNRKPAEAFWWTAAACSNCESDCK